MSLHNIRRAIIFTAALLVGMAMSQVEGQTTRASESTIKVRLERMSQGASKAPDAKLVRTVSEWTDDVLTVINLLNQGADPNAVNDSGQVALSIAATRDNRRVVRELFAAGARLDGSVFAGADGLSWAARLAQPEITATLLASGADPNAYDVEGFTPLLRAAFHDAAVPFMPAHAQLYAAVAELLLSRGADPELPKRQATGTALRETVSPYDILGATPLTLAAGNCADGLVTLLVRRGATVSTTGALNMPPLMHAAQRGCDDAVRLLLGAKAPVDQTGHQGETALVMAAMQTQYGLEHVRIVEMLIAAGASRDAAKRKLAERLQDGYYREYPLHGRVNAEKILRLLGA